MIKKPACLLMFCLLAVFLIPHAAESATASVSNNTPLDVDGSSGTRTVDITAAELPPGETLTNVNVTVDFLKTDGSCATPGTGNSYHSEIVYQITSPMGTTVNLITSGTFTGGDDVPPVTITFDDAAASVVGGVYPVSGTFQPVSPLSAFNGEDPQGTWTLYVEDTVGADPLCHYSFTLDLETEALAIGAIPTLNEVGIVVMALLLATLGFAALRRRGEEPA